MDAFGGEGKVSWIYENDIEEVWRSFVEREESGANGKVSNGVGH